MLGIGLHVLFDDEEIFLNAKEKQIARVAWTDITRVVIRTTDEGPYFPDVYWEIYKDDGEPAILYFQSVSGTDELLAEMQRRLPGFANDRLIQAMSSSSNDLFVLWTKE
jgi:hypothetical protein